MAGVEEGNRQKIAMGLALAGAGLVLGGLFLGIQQLEQTEALLTRPASQPSRPVVADAGLIRTVLFYLLLLVGIFAVASLAFLRWSRSFRRWMFHKPAAATPSDDLWLMHRLPDEQTSPGEENPSSEDPDGEI